jgi:Protein of unknown function (DUF2555)
LVKRLEKLTTTSSDSNVGDAPGSADKLSDLKIDLNDLNALKKLTSKDVEELARRLEEDNYPNAFAGLHDWHLLRAIAYNIPHLVEPFRHLLDIEPFDEC